MKNMTKEIYIKFAIEAIVIEKSDINMQITMIE